jgi:hypothetical protein
MSQHVINQRKTGLPRKLKALLLPLLALFGGCVYSLQPWYAEGSGGADPTLKGVWREVDGQDAWVFLAQGDSLCLLYQDDGQTGEFTAVTFNVEGQDFLDLTPAAAGRASGPMGWYQLPMHGLHRWSLSGDTLRMSSLNPQTLDTQLQLGTHPPLQEMDNRWIFTGSREEMSALVADQLLDPALYDEPTVMVRE